MGVASRFGLTLELDNRNPAVVWETFAQGGNAWGGFRTKLLIDGGGFEAAFRKEADSNSDRRKTTSAETPPQQIDVCERRGGTWMRLCEVRHRPMVCVLPRRGSHEVDRRLMQSGPQLTRRRHRLQKAAMGPGAMRLPTIS